MPCAISFYTKSGFLSTGIFAIFHNRIKFRRFYHIYRTLFEQYANFPGGWGGFGGEGGQGGRTRLVAGLPCL